MQVSFCKKHELGQLMAFIGTHWSPNHILAKSESLMLWQHEGSDQRELDYVIARNDEGVQGVLGFIPTSRFDPALAEQCCIWLALWKVKDDAPAGCGMQMLAFLRREIPHRLIGTVGINQEVAKLFSALGFEVLTLKQLYVLHPSKPSFRVAKVPAQALRCGPTQTSAAPPTLRAIDEAILSKLGNRLDQLWPAQRVPKKSAAFFIQRFIKHPFYRYTILSIERDGDSVGLLVGRFCTVQGARVFRIVDGCLPDPALVKLGPALQAFLVQSDAEFADLMQHGLPDQALSESGFLTLQCEQTQTVIPNYYEPFLQSNILVKGAYKTKEGDHVVTMKADADQDRPNQVERAA